MYKMVSKQYIFFEVIVNEWGLYFGAQYGNYIYYSQAILFALIGKININEFM